MKMFYKLATKIRSVILSFPPRIDITDNYIKRLLLVNPGMMHEGNLYCFRYAIQHLKSTKPIMEIGGFCGLSTNVMSYYLHQAKRGNKIFSCDSWNYGFKKSKSFGTFSASESEFDKFVEECYIRNVSLFSKPHFPHAFKLLSDDFFDLWSKKRTAKDVFGKNVRLGGKISFCYIDAEHTYRQTKKHFENADKLLEKGGFIFFDDSAIYSGFGSANLMAEILKNKKYKLIINNPNYLFQKIKQ